MKNFSTFSNHLAEAMLPSAFPILDKITDNTRQQELFYAAVNTVRDMLSGQTKINKSGFERVKNHINFAVEYVWKSAVRQGADAFEEMKTDNELSSVCYGVYRISHISSVLKKYISKEHKSPTWTKVITLAKEFAPLAAAIDQAKTKIVSGRIVDPNAKPKQINPNQVRGTCGMCEMNHAIDYFGKMVHHGYQRPGGGFQTPSCLGIGYKCLEISDEALHVRLKWATSQAQNLAKKIADLPGRTEIHPRELGLRLGQNTKAYTTKDINWKSILMSLGDYLGREHDFLNTTIRRTKTQIVEWKSVLGFITPQRKKQ